MRLRPLQKTRLVDPEIEEVRRTHADAITDLQKVVTSGVGVILPAVVLVDATAVTVAHKLGREPRMIATSPPRNATTTGRITEVFTAIAPRDKFIVLRADGWGSTITIDVEIK